MSYELGVIIFFFKQKTAYEMCGRDWSSDVCSSDLSGLIVNVCCFSRGGFPIICHPHYQDVTTPNAHISSANILTPSTLLSVLHPSQSTLHCTLHPLYSTHSTLHSPLSPLYSPPSILYTLHPPLSTLYTLLSTLYSPLSTLHSLHSTFHSTLSTLHSPHSTLHSPPSTLYSPPSTLYTLLHSFRLKHPEEEDSALDSVTS